MNKHNSIQIYHRILNNKCQAHPETYYKFKILPESLKGLTIF